MADQQAMLIRLSETGETVARVEDDVRGRKVRDRDGEELGEVKDLLVDDREHRVRLLQVEHGGILGFGAQHAFIPVDAITSIGPEEVVVDVTREHVAGAPTYDPELVDEPVFYGSLYGYYGYPGFWGPGAYPGYPL